MRFAYPCFVFILFSALHIPGVVAATAQSPVSGNLKAYDPRLTFAPLILPDAANAYRSSNGAPGPSYWQNEADYEMHAALDTKGKLLSNDETITYTNNSPNPLSSLWINTEQNMCTKTHEM